MSEKGVRGSRGFVGIVFLALLLIGPFTTAAVYVQPRKAPVGVIRGRISDLAAFEGHRSRVSILNSFKSTSRSPDMHKGGVDLSRC